MGKEMIEERRRKPPLPIREIKKQRGRVCTMYVHVLYKCVVGAHGQLKPLNVLRATLWAVAIKFFASDAVRARVDLSLSLSLSF